MFEKLRIGVYVAESYKNPRKHGVKVEKKLFTGTEGLEERFKMRPTKENFRMNCLLNVFKQNVLFLA